jgi:integrase
MTNRNLLQFKPWTNIELDSGELPPDSPYSRDVWDVRELGAQSLTIAQQYGHYKLDFSTIEQPWLRTAIKKFIKYRLSNSAFTTVANSLDSMRHFAEFLSESYPDLLPSEMNRAIVLDYLTFLANAKYQARRGFERQAVADRLLSPRTRQARIYILRLFIDTCIRNHWLDFPAEPMVYPEDLPPRVKSQPRFIPDEVIEQLNAKIDLLPEPYMRMVLILEEGGMRISELCTIKFDCIFQDASGDWWLKYYQSKMKKDHTITISKEIVAVIQEQQQFIRENLGDDYEFLFCARTVAGKREAKKLDKRFPCIPKPPNSATLNHQLNVLAEIADIRDVSGKLWHFSAHQFRHSVGTSMINRKVPLHIVARYLGHESLQMTLVYAHIHDETLKEEFAKLNHKIVDIAGTVIEDRTVLDENDLQWFKQHVHAQALPNGSCALPAVQKQCPHANACLTCTHFRTTPEFLNQHKVQLAQTEQIIEKAKENGWERQVEMNERIAQNLRKIIQSLESENEA